MVDEFVVVEEVRYTISNVGMHAVLDEQRGTGSVPGPVSMMKRRNCTLLCRQVLKDHFELRGITP